MQQRPLIAALAALSMMVMLLAGCVTPPGDEQRESWRLDVPARHRIGQEGSFELSGSPWSLHGSLFVAGLGGQWTFDVASAGRGDHLFFPDARIGSDAPVFLVLEGGRIVAQAGSVGGFDARAITSDGVAITITAHDDHFGGAGRMPEWPSDRQEAEDAYTFGQRVGGAVRDLLVTGYERAWTIQDGAVAAMDEVPPFAAPGWVWGRGSTVETTEGFDVDAQRFALGGSLRGTLASENGAVRDPEGVFGNDADLEVAPASVRAAPFRLTQALTDDGLLMDATIEADPVEDKVVVRAGKTDWLAINYRERGYYGDAVIEDIVIEGPGAHMVKVPTAPGTFIQELWQFALAATQEAPWAAPFFAIPVVIASPFVVMTEIIACVFGECPEGHPYPVWMEAASVGVFYVKVQPRGDQAAGEYPVTVRLEGQNHPTETFSFVVQVHE